MEAWVRNAKVGDRVECIVNAIGAVRYEGFPLFKKGMRLTISRIDLDDCDGLFAEPEPFFAFEEEHPDHTGHWAGFRPLQSCPTSIEVFTKLLNTAPAEVLEKA
jgi:hypothetical protein